MADKNNGAGTVTASKETFSKSQQTKNDHIPPKMDDTKK